MKLSIILISIFLQVELARSQINIWSDFGPWSKCLPECQQGTRTRTRTCLAQPCIDDPFENENCNDLCGCQKIPCGNGGTCIQNVDDLRAYSCVCLSGFAGNDSHSCDISVGTNDNALDVGTSGLSITSPFYPNIYPMNQNTKWTLSVPAGKGIQLEIPSFNVGPTQAPGDCVADYAPTKSLYQSMGVDPSFILSDQEINSFCPCILDMILIYEGTNTSLSNLKGVYCNAKPPPAELTFKTNQLTIVFRSDQINLVDALLTEIGFQIKAILPIITTTTTSTTTTPTTTSTTTTTPTSTSTVTTTPTTTSTPTTASTTKSTTTATTSTPVTTTGAHGPLCYKCMAKYNYVCTNNKYLVRCASGQACRSSTVWSNTGWTFTMKSCVDKCSSPDKNVKYTRTSGGYCCFKDKCNKPSYIQASPKTTTPKLTTAGQGPLCYNCKGWFHYICTLDKYLVRCAAGQACQSSSSWGAMGLVYTSKSCVDHCRYPDRYIRIKNSGRYCCYRDGCNKPMGIKNKQGK